MSIVTRTYIWSRQVGVMTHKEIVQLARDMVLILFIVYSFTLDIYLAGSGITLQLNNAATVVHEGDRTSASREIIGLFQKPFFQIEGAVGRSGEGIQRMDTDKAMVVLDIPSGFQDSLRRGTPARMQMLVDATNSVLGTLAVSYGEAIVGAYALDEGLHRLGLSRDILEQAPRVEIDRRVRFNANLDDAWFMSITELMNMITLFAIMLPAAAMAREKERGTIEQLLVSPLTPFQIMLAKVLAMTVIILLGTLVALFGILHGCFHVPFRGSLWLFMGVTMLYVVTTTGIGLVIASIAANLAQVGLMSLMVFAPMVFLSGAWTPPEALPVWLQQLMLIFPLHYYLDAGFAILLKDASLATLAPSIEGIVLLGSVVFGFGLWRFRRQFE